MQAKKALYVILHSIAASFLLKIPRVANLFVQEDDQDEIDLLEPMKIKVFDLQPKK